MSDTPETPTTPAVPADHSYDPRWTEEPGTGNFFGGTPNLTNQLAALDDNALLQTINAALAARKGA